MSLQAASEGQLEHWSLDDVAEQLTRLRVQAGRPSFSTIARRVRQIRSGRGVPPEECEPGRITVYDCFRQGRRRMQPELVSDIVLALGASFEQAHTWAQACTAAQMQADAAAVVTVRTSLPSSPGPFVGRTEQITDIVDTVRHGPGAVVVLHGMPGSGKSRLAFRAADALVSAGLVRRALVAELRGHHAKRPPAAPPAVIDALLRALGLPGREVPPALADRQALLTRMLDDHQAVVVLDDAHDSAQVEALLPQSKTPVIVSSRRVLAALSPTVSMPVGPLETSQAVELLATIGNSHYTGTDRATAAELVQAAGLLPLSVGLLATRVAARPHWSLTDQLEALHSRRAALQLDDDLELALHLSYRPLGEQARRSLRLLALHPCDELDPLACAALFGQEPEQTANTLQQLSQRHLVLERTPQRYSLHDLTRAFALARSYDEDRPADRDAALSRLHGHLVGSARTAAEVLGFGCDPRSAVAPSGRIFADESEAAQWVVDEFDTLLAISAHGVAHDHPDTAMQISEDLSFWLIRCSDRADLADLHDYALRAATELDDTDGMARAALALGQVAVRESRFDEAIPALQRAQAAFEVSTDHLGASRALTALAMIDVHQGRLSTAIERFTQVLQTTDSTDPVRHGIALDNLAVAYIRAGRLEEALQCQQQSLALADDSGDRYTRANVLSNMASVHQQRGAADQAYATARESLSLGEQLASVPIMAYAMSIKGRALIDMGRLDAAERTLRGARRLAIRLNDQVLRGNVAAHLALVAQLRGAHEQARRGFEEARNIAASVGASFEEASALTSLGELALAAGDPAGAGQLWRSAVEVLEAMGSPEEARVRSLLQSLDRG